MCLRFRSQCHSKEDIEEEFPLRIIHQACVSPVPQIIRRKGGGDPARASERASTNVPRRRMAWFPAPQVKKEMLEVIQPVLQQGVPDRVVDAAVANAPTPEGKRRRRRRRKGAAADSYINMLQEATREADFERARLAEVFQQRSVKCLELACCRARQAALPRVRNHVNEGAVNAICTEGYFLACEACTKELMQHW